MPLFWIWCTPKSKAKGSCCSPPGQIRWTRSCSYRRGCWGDHSSMFLVANPSIHQQARALSWPKKKIRTQQAVGSQLMKTVQSQSVGGVSVAENTCVGLRIFPMSKCMDCYGWSVSLASDLTSTVFRKSFECQVEHVRAYLEFLNSSMEDR